MGVEGANAGGRRAHKRGHGEGSVYQRADGRWVGSVMLGRRPDGKPDRPKAYGRTRAEVVRQLAELRRRQEEGSRADSATERQTVGSYLERWLEAARTSTRPRTWERYNEVVHHHVLPALGHQRLTSLRPDALQRLYAAKLAEGLAPRTVLKVHMIVHRALRMAVRWGYVSRNAADAVDPPTVAKHDITLPKPIELAHLLDTALRSDDRLAALWTLALLSGCRQGELLALAWSDVDLDAATLTVRRSLVEVRDMAPHFGEPKTGTSRRTISLPSEALAVLRTHRARQNEERLAAGLDWADYGLVFATHLGTPLIARNVVRDFKRALARAGLPGTIRFHDLRHAHATLMLRAGVPLKVASGRLGHSSIAITGDLYQHWVGDLDVQAAERAQRAMRGLGSDAASP